MRTDRKIARLAVALTLGAAAGATAPAGAEVRLPALVGGDADDIHPRNKQDVGARLAGWALADSYGKPLDASGPLYLSLSEGGPALRVRFSHAAGLTASVAVRYAWADNPEATLGNGEGLPASPFRTDDWPGLTAPRVVAP